MNTANGGDILFHIKGDSKDLESKVKGIKGIAEGAGKVIGASFVAGTAIATAAVAKFVKDATSSFAEFEQLEGGLEAMFKDNAEGIENVTQRSQKAYKDLQMSQNEYLKSFENSYMLVKNGLGEEADAIEYTNKTLQLSADLFNTYGGSTEQYANAINWALKGTFSYVDNLNLGIKGTQEGFVEAANASGILAREISDVKDLTNDEIIDVIQHYAEEAGAWGRSTEEASKTIQGSLNMAKASWKDLVNEFGKKNGNIDEAFNNFMDSATTFGENLFPLLERILVNVVEYLPTIVDKLGQALPGLLENLIPPILDSAIKVLQAIVNAMPQVIQTLAQMLPTIITSVINGLVTIVKALAEQMPTLIPTIVDAILEIIPVLIDNLPLFIEVGGELLVGIAEGLIKALPKLLEKTPEIIWKLVQAFGSLPGEFLNIGKDLIKGLWNGIKDMGGWIKDKLKGFGSGLVDKVKEALGIHSPSKVFANQIGKWIPKGIAVGITANTDSIYEAMKDIENVALSGLNLDTMLAPHYSPTINVVNNVDMKTDPLGQVVANIKTFSNGAKNDYNYGMGV